MKAQTEESGQSHGRRPHQSHRIPNDSLGMVLTSSRQILFGESAPGEVDQITENTNEGIDTLSFASQATSVILSLCSTAIQPAHTNRSATLNSVSTIETLIGGFGADPQTGNSLNNTLTGSAGSELERNMPFRIELRIMMRSN